MDVQLIRWNINRRIQVQYYSTSPQHLWITTWWEILHWFLHTLPCKRRIVSIHRIRTHGASSRWNWGMCPMNVAQWTVSNLNCPSEQGLGETLRVLSNLSSLFLCPKNGSSQVQIAYRRSGWFFLPWFWMRSYMEQNPGWRVPQPTHGVSKNESSAESWLHRWKGRGELSLPTPHPTPVSNCTLQKFLSLPSKWHWLAGILKAAWTETQIKNVSAKLPIAFIEIRATGKLWFCSPHSLRRTGLMWKLFSLIACLQALHFPPMSLKIDVVGGCFMGWIFSLEKRKGALHRGTTQDVSDQSTEQINQRKQKCLRPVETDY